MLIGGSSPLLDGNRNSARSRNGMLKQLNVQDTTLLRLAEANEKADTVLTEARRKYIQYSMVHNELSETLFTRGKGNPDYSYEPPP